MKSLQKLVKSFTPNMTKDHVLLNYFQVKEGKVLFSNGISGIIYDAEDVFGQDVVKKDEEEFYISYVQWAALKCDKAIGFVRKGDAIEVLQKGSFVGDLKLFTTAEIGTFYPNIEGVIPTRYAPVPIFKFNLTHLKNHCETIGGDTFTVSYLRNGTYLVSPEDTNLEPIKEIFSGGYLHQSIVEAPLKDIQKELSMKEVHSETLIPA